MGGKGKSQGEREKLITAKGDKISIKKILRGKNNYHTMPTTGIQCIVVMRNPKRSDPGKGSKELSNPVQTVRGEPNEEKGKIARELRTRIKNTGPNTSTDYPQYWGT